MWTGDSEDVVLDLDPHVLGLDPEDIRAHDEVAVAALEADHRRPAALTAARKLGPGQEIGHVGRS